MPRRKRRTTGQTQQQIPTSSTTVALNLHGNNTTTIDEKEPDNGLSFKVHGSPIVSPRSIRKNLSETDVDMERKGSVIFGPPRPPQPNSDSSMSYFSSSNNGLSIESTCRTSPFGGPSSLDTEETPKDVIQREQEERQRQAASPSMSDNAQLARLGGAQLWVHRVLSTHHQTLQALGVERQDFPNTKLSLKQVEMLLSPMVSICNLMTTSQFGIQAPTSAIARTMTEVHYWKLWESDTIDMGIFFMPPNAVIPLHNHPGMSVVTRILYGSAQVTSFDLMSTADLVSAHDQGAPSFAELQDEAEDVKWARVSREGEYVGESTMWLDPRRFNLHHIRANPDIGCALLDIMIPPYDNADRDCHHFKVIAERILAETSQRIVQMIESVTPDNHNEPSSRETAAAMNVE